MAAKAPHYELAMRPGFEPGVTYHPVMKVAFAPESGLLLARDGPELIGALPRRAIAPIGLEGPLALAVHAQNRIILRHGSAAGVEEWLSDLRSGGARDRLLPVEVQSFPATALGIAAINARLAAAAQLGAVPWGSGPGETGGRFVSVMQPVTAIFKDQSLDLIRMLQRAVGQRAAISRCDAAALARSDEEHKASTSYYSGSGREERPDLTGWVPETIGTALRVCDASDREALIGRDFAEGIDAAYGRFCTETYDRAVAGQAPIVEDVGALVRRSDGDFIETRYRRLVIPFRAREGGWLIVVKSVFGAGSAQAA